MFDFLKRRLGIDALGEKIRFDHNQWIQMGHRFGEMNDHLAEIKDMIKALTPVVSPVPDPEEIPEKPRKKKLKTRDGETRKKVLDYLHQRPGKAVHYTEVMAELGCTEGQACSTLAALARQQVVYRAGRGAYILVSASEKVQEYLLSILQKHPQTPTTAALLSRQLGWTKGQISAALAPMVSRGDVARLTSGVYALPDSGENTDDPQ